LIVAAAFSGRIVVVNKSLISQRHLWGGVRDG
jgi:hypothetical protein